MEKLKTIVAATITICVVGCASQRSITLFETPTGELKCADPPSDVLMIGGNADLQALVPEIDLDVKANTSVSTTVARIRSEIPNLQAIEVLEYRMCLAYGSGIIDAKTYQEFFKSILPLLKNKEERKATLNSQEAQKLLSIFTDRTTEIDLPDRDFWSKSQIFVDLLKLSKSSELLNKGNQFLTAVKNARKERKNPTHPTPWRNYPSHPFYEYDTYRKFFVDAVFLATE